MAVLDEIYNDLVTAVATVVPLKNIYLGRPDIGDDGQAMTKFAVLDLPASITDVAAGNGQLMLRTRGLLSLFVKSKSNKTLNVKAMGDITDKAMALFPVSGTYAVAANPILMLCGNDQNGFSYAEITFEIHTKKRNTQ